MPCALTIDADGVAYECSWSIAYISCDSHGDILYDGAIEIGHDHDIELLGGLDQLHRGVVDDHLLVLQMGILFGHLPASLQKQAITYLHDIGLVNGSDLFPAGETGELEAVVGDLETGLHGGDLDGLDHSRVDFVLDPRVLPLGVLPNYHRVHVLVSRPLQAGNGNHGHHLRK